MKKRKLNYRFHNPNSMADTAEFLYELLIESNRDKVDRVVEQIASNNIKSKNYIVNKSN